jgi:hypothetical protein
LSGAPSSATDDAAIANTIASAIEARVNSLETGMIENSREGQAD